MAIDNPQAIEFVRVQARPLANVIALAYWQSKKATALWVSDGVADVCPNTQDLVSDGSAKQVTGAEVTNTITRAMELIADLEANGNAKLNTVLAATTLE